MKKYIILLTVILSISVNLEAQAIWNPFKYIHINESNASGYSDFTDVKDAVNKLIDGYESRQLSQFMNCISEDYVFDNDILESQMRTMFSRYSFIKINFVINSIIPDSKGNFAVSINYTKQLEDRKIGKFTSKNGTATLFLKKENGEFKLYRIQNQKLF